jgi:hypothetical protein
MCHVSQSGLVRLSHVSLLRRGRGPTAAPQQLNIEPLSDTIPTLLSLLSAWLPVASPAVLPGTNQEVWHSGSHTKPVLLHCMLGHRSVIYNITESECLGCQSYQHLISGTWGRSHVVDMSHTASVGVPQN